MKTVLPLCLALAGTALAQDHPVALKEWQAESSVVTSGELRLANQWSQAIVAPGSSPGQWLDHWLSAGLPFSFRFDGQESAALLKSWRFEAGEPKSAGAATVQELSWTDPASGLRVGLTVRRFAQEPAVEWLLTFANRGEKQTPIIEDIQALNLWLQHGQAGGSFVVHGAAGGRSFPDDMQPFSRVLRGDHNRELSLGGDFPSSNAQLPFFNLESPEHRGVMVGIGWSGRWLARIRADANSLRAQAGLSRSHFRLHPGEQVRAPRVLVLFWEGQTLHGHNAFRQLLHQHYVPALHGEPQKPLVSVNVCFTYHGFGGFLHDARADTVSALIEPFSRIGSELLVLDAGWYEGAPWNEWQGNWRYSTAKYPQGLRPIADALAAHGQSLGLWFSLENANDHAPVMKEHPEWLRLSPDGRSATLRMELPQAREWALQAVDDAVNQQGVACFRQDGAGWFDAEPADRQGISESQHVAGLYELWDQIVARHPALIMEGCCGGGRRIDLETVSRFHWHQKSDRWYDSESDQLSLYGANLYLPGGIINLPTERTDDYGAWSSFGGQFCLGWHPLDPGFPFAEARRQVERYKRIRSLLSGDFYPLTPASLDQTWIAYQFHRPDLDHGFALVFRRPEAGSTVYPVSNTFRVELRGLDPRTRYRVHTEHVGRTQTMSGSALRRGMDIVLNQPRSAELIEYEKK